MKFTKSALMGVGGVLLAGLILTLIAPKAAHAIAATAVQVTNTTGNPVINQDTSQQASEIVNLACYGSNTASNPCYAQAASPGINPYVVPSGEKLVISSLTVTPGGGPGASMTFFLQGALPDGLSSTGSINLAASTTLTTQYSWLSGFIIPGGSSVWTNPPESAFVYVQGYLTAN
jgi:hypothetical protein